MREEIIKGLVKMEEMTRKLTAQTITEDNVKTYVALMQSIDKAIKVTKQYLKDYPDDQQ